MSLGLMSSKYLTASADVTSHLTHVSVKSFTLNISRAILNLQKYSVLFLRIQSIFLKIKLYFSHFKLLFDVTHPI